MNADWNSAHERAIEDLEEGNPELGKKFRRLCDILRGYKSAVVAFSGGVDSSLLAYLCHRILKRELCVTADSPTLPRKELEDAICFAQIHGLNHRVISHSELDDERFVKNDLRRCFYCKDGLFLELEEIRAREGYDFVMDGSNHDDLDDFRPGREAAVKNAVKSPLLEAQLKKEDIRIISKVLGLSTWGKPQMACLSSRFPRDTPISIDDLRKIEKAEDMVRALGYHDVRVRFYKDLAKIEVGPNEEIDLKKLKGIVPSIKELGFRFVTLDLEGFRSGSLNE